MINNAADAIIAKIASITIKGIVVGFTAQQIGAFKSLNFTTSLIAAPINLAPMGDVTIREA